MQQNDISVSRRLVSADLNLPPYQGVALTQVRRVISADDLACAAKHLRAAEVIGFDTESKPTFRKGEVSTGPHLIQLASDSQVFLFQVGSAGLSSDVHALLAEVMAAPHILKVGFGLRDDVKRMKQKFGFTLIHVLDLAVALRTEPRKDVGAKGAVARFFGQKMQKSKSISTTNWANPVLSDRQVLYAADDAMVALRIYRHWHALPAGQSLAETDAPARSTVS